MSAMRSHVHTSALVAEVDSLVSDVRLVRAAEWVADADVTEDWAVSETEARVENLDDTAKYSRKDLENALNSGMDRRATVPAFPAPPSTRKVRAK